MKFGFFIRQLALEGPGVGSAKVMFARGLNVIAGPSDTGKSFIVQCLDYALGSGDPPKEIPQGKGYSSVVLEIEANSDQRVYTLERNLRGGDVLCRTTGHPDRTLAAKHQGGKQETVSQFLLDLSGLGTKRVCMNKHGKTRQLSFRDLARLVIIDEEMIIKQTSPVLSGQYTLVTVENSVFRLLLTGIDDSSVVANEEVKLAKVRKAGKIELLEELLKSTRERLAAYAQVGTLTDERDRLSQVEVSIQTALGERNAAQASVVPLQAKRNTIWSHLRKTESKLVVYSELQRRFDLLQEQYSSDLRRLETIAEAAMRLGQLKEERCPMCGALEEHHAHAHRVAGSSPTAVATACKAEATKTSRLFRDLQSTRTGVAAEVKQLQEARDILQSDLSAISVELKEMMDQHVDIANKKVDDLRSRLETCRKVIGLLEHIEELEKLLEEANKPVKKTTDVAAGAVSTAQAEPFCREVESLLKAWHFPGLRRVSFSEDSQDIVISGRARNSHGKGVRAITRAAFNLALLRLCVKGDQPFPNFVVIDSPLLVYEEPEPDTDELSFPPEVKTYFWKSMKELFAAGQVIVIENSKQLPGDEEIRNMNVVRFTGNDQGRRGFIPQDPVT